MGRWGRKEENVKWESLRLSKENGGFGISSVLDKNKGLLAKWLWRFEKEELSLWKRVICAKYKVPSNALCWVGTVERLVPFSLWR